MSDCVPSSPTSTCQDTRAQLRFQMSVRLPNNNNYVADEHEMSDDQLSSSDNEALEDLIVLPPIAEDVDRVHLPDLVPRNDDIFLQRQRQLQLFREIGRELRDLGDRFLAIRLHQKALEKRNADNQRIDLGTIAILIGGLVATAVVPYMVHIKCVRWVYS